jgi:hypothetical protein
MTLPPVLQAIHSPDEAPPFYIDAFNNTIPDTEDGVGQVRKTPKSARKLGQLQPFIAVFSQECTGQPASFG